MRISFSNSVLKSARETPKMSYRTLGQREGPLI
jgi:hypothetical protein